MNVRISANLSERIQAHAARAYPHEACGLLSGQITEDGREAEITGIHESANVTGGDPAIGFEIDPKLRFELMRALEAQDDGTEIIGHYHSHPDHPAEPSATDLSMTYEVDFIWLICAVGKDGTTELNAFKPRPDRSRFDALNMETGPR